MTTTFEGINYQALSSSTAKVTGSSIAIDDIIIPPTVEIGGVLHTVIEIANGAFAYKAINTISLPNTIATIATNAFIEIEGLRNINIPNSVTSMGTGIFGSLTVDLEIDMALDSIITYLPDSFFETGGDPKVTVTINIPDSVTTLGISCFVDTNPIISGGINVNTLGNSCFAICRITELPVFPKVTSYPDFCFAECLKLVNIIIPDNITDIGNNCFTRNTGMNAISFDTSSLIRNYTIGSSVQNIGAQAFIFGVFADYYDTVNSYIWKDQSSLVSVGTDAFKIWRHERDDTIEQGTVAFENISSYSELSDVSQSIFPSYGLKIYYNGTLNNESINTTTTVLNNVLGIPVAPEDITTVIQNDITVDEVEYIYKIQTTTQNIVFETLTEENKTEIINQTKDSYSRELGIPKDRILVTLSSGSLIVVVSILSPQPQLCFKRDTKIRIYDIKEGKEKDELIQHLKKGDLVKTITNWGEYHAIYEIRSSKVNNDRRSKERVKDRLYKCKESSGLYEGLYEDLIITGAHSILVPELEKEYEDRIKKEYGEVFVTDGNYRLPAYIDRRSEIYEEEEGEIEIYNFALESESMHSNNGVFANGLLVESTTKFHISGM
ncbi:leucine-rich repeat domain-containing protein [bacterium]|nr:leucine-rich repeat domain-containing protein [bacterium]